MKDTKLSMPSVICYTAALCAVVIALFSAIFNYAGFAEAYYEANTQGAGMGAAKQLPSADKMEVRKVKFTYYNPKAKEVYLNADFNLWGRYEMRLEKDSNGEFSAVCVLPQGDYKYYFSADGVDFADKKNNQKAKYGDKEVSVKTVL